MSTSPVRPAVQLGSGREFDRIRAIARALGARASGLGDDCALLPAGSGTLALSTDVSVENVHFRLDWLDLEEVGWRAGAAALSDLAAEAARPEGMLVALVAPPAASEADLTAVMSGAASAGAAVGAPVIGGDLSTGPVWSIMVTVVGRAVTPVTRAGARVGDGLWLTGALGGARAALEAWRRGVTPAVSARAAFAHPEPRIAAGQWLAVHGARAMIDVSDGLGGDAGHIAAASGVALRLALDRVPVASDAVAEARRLDLPVQHFAAEGGEDYELLASLPEEFASSDAMEFQRDCGIALTRVGEVEQGSGVHATLGGHAVVLAGFNHFAQSH
ncbi:MAG TPA: thiamine-phosphate kinase [Gemmatimonadales bacterium]